MTSNLFIQLMAVDAHLWLRNFAEACPSIVYTPPTTAMSIQSYQEIVSILRSLPSVKNVRLQVNKAAYFGVAWAASQDQETFVGTVSNWRTKDRVLMIKWEGWAKNRQCPIDTLDEDSDGSSLDLTLLPYDDGRPPPQLVDHPWTTDGAQHGEAAGEDHNDHEDDEGAREAEVTITARQPVKPLNISSQTWSKLEPEGVAHDERQTPRQQPVLNAGFGFSNISSVFHYLLPDAWIDVQLPPRQVRRQVEEVQLARGRDGQAMGTVVKVFQGDKDPTLTRAAGGSTSEDESHATWAAHPTGMECGNAQGRTGVRAESAVSGSGCEGAGGGRGCKSAIFSDSLD